MSYYRGVTLLRDKRYAEALALYERLLKRSPKLVSAWFGKAGALYSLGRGVEALVAIERHVSYGAYQVGADLGFHITATERQA